MLEQGRIVTWLDRNSEYADDLDAVQELLDDATLITINANLFETNSASLQKTPNLATRPSSNPARVLPTSRSTSELCLLASIGLLLGAVIAQAEGIRPRALPW